MGCCTSNSSNRVKEPVRVIRHREEYVEDEKEGDDAKGNYEKKQTFPHAVVEQSIKPLEDKIPPENKAPEVSRVVESRVDHPETEIKPEMKKQENDTKGEIIVENISEVVTIQKFNKESQHVDKYLEGNDLTRVTRKDPEPLGNMEMSGFNELKGFRSDDMVESRQRLHSEESSYKITREQHTELLRFVDERRSYMQGEVFMLYQSLAQHAKEDEGLALMVEDLKSWNKDVENCMDDIKSYRFQDDEAYLSSVVQTSDLIKKIVFGFGTYKKNLKTYKELKEETMSLLLRVEPRIEENSQAYMRLRMNGSVSRGRRKSDRPPTSLTFIPREEVRENEEDQGVAMEDQVDLRLELR